MGFLPAVSGKALKAMTASVRRWRIQRRSDKSLVDIARMFRSVLSGWIAYYGKYYRSALYPVFRTLNRRLVRWARQKYKRLGHQRRATHWLRRIARRASAGPTSDASASGPARTGAVSALANGGAVG